MSDERSEKMEVDEKTGQPLYGWIDWSGGNPPDENWRALVDIEERSGRMRKSVQVGARDWGWTYGKYNHWDIIRFRLVTNEDTLERKEAAESNKSEGLKGREKAALEFQHELSEIFKDGPPDSSFGDSVMKENFEAKHGDSSGGSRAKAGTHSITNPDRVIAITNEGRTTITQQRGALGRSPQKHGSRGPHHSSHK